MHFCLCLEPVKHLGGWLSFRETILSSPSLSSLAYTSGFLCISEDIFRRFLTEHERGYHWEGPRHPGERARIDNPETQNPMDLKLGIQHCHRVVTSANCTCRGSMMRPGL